MTIITNSYDPEAKRPRLSVERHRIYAPETEWTYSHHPSIAFFRDRFVAIWSNGRVHEDDVGQRVLMSTSRDFEQWTPSRPLWDSTMGQERDLTLTAAGLYAHEGTLVAYAGQWEYPDSFLEDAHRKAGRPPCGAHLRTTLSALTSTDAGESWSVPLDLGLPVVSNHGPQPLASGRLMISGNISYPYTDDPGGLSGWTMGGLYPADMADAVLDDPAGFREVARARNWPSALCEGSWFQTDDGVVHLLLRSHEKRLWQSESRDEGETWSAPVPSDFTDNNTKFHFGRLPDGRFYHLGCPDPVGDRTPLVLTLSEDGVVFDRAFIVADDVYEMKREGLHKNGQFGYPHSRLHGDSLYAIASRRKEAVDVFRVALSVL